MDHGDGEGSALKRFPLVKWARKLSGGTVRVDGVVRPIEGQAIELGRGVGLATAGVSLEVAPGPARLSFVFVGGEGPHVVRVRLLATEVVVRVADGRAHGRHLEWVAAGGATTRGAVTADTLTLDGSPVVGGRLDPPDGLVAALVDALWDVDVEARVQPAGELAVRFAGGVQLVVPDGLVMTLSGGTSGAPDDLSLCRPLVVGFSGDGVVLRQRNLQRVSRRMTVRLSRAALHPDGQVALEGDGPSVLGLAVRGGLEVASTVFGRLVRSSPRFEAVRGFLRVG